VVMNQVSSGDGKSNRLYLVLIFLPFCGIIRLQKMAPDGCFFYGKYIVKNVFCG